MQFSASLAPAGKQKQQDIRSVQVEMSVFICIESREVKCDPVASVQVSDRWEHTRSLRPGF